MSAIPWRKALDTFGPAAALLLLIAYTGWREPAFLRLENILNILQQWSFIGIVAVGMTLVIILGGIDLSVGALAALAGGLGIWLMNTVISAAMIIDEVSQAAEIGIEAPYGTIRLWLAQAATSLGLTGSEAWGLTIAIFTTLSVGLLAGLLNGTLITKGRLAPFIATLGTLAAFRSLALALADGGEFRSDSATLFKMLGTGGIAIPGTNVAPPTAPAPIPLLLPYPVIAFIVIAIIGHVLLRMTRYGRYVVAIGCNERAAVYSAINVDRVKLLTYTLIGVCTAVAAIMVSSRMNSVSSAQTGQLWELDAIAAVVIGGTRMRGGAGSVIGTVIGVLFLGVVGNMLNLLDVSPYLQGLVKGLIIIAAVLLQRSDRAN